MLRAVTLFRSASVVGDNSLLMKFKKVLDTVSVRIDEERTFLLQRLASRGTLAFVKKGKDRAFVSVAARAGEKEIFPRVGQGIITGTVFRSTFLLPISRLGAEVFHLAGAFHKEGVAIGTFAFLIVAQLGFYIVGSVDDGLKVPGAEAAPLGEHAPQLLDFCFHLGQAECMRLGAFLDASHRLGFELIEQLQKSLCVYIAELSHLSIQFLEALGLFGGAVRSVNQRIPFAGQFVILRTAHA